MTVKLKPNEVVLKAGDTSQVIDKATVAGKLIVTNQGLYFKTLMDETEKFNLEILFDNIRGKSSTSIRVYFPPKD
ncbi:MAG: hypothetical protein U5L72_13370 [Bacteroidales bacterium]|nr:hypothetical protein [Bacteroidales bacterium]